MEEIITPTPLVAEEPKGYQFDETRHIHSLDGKPLTGTTTVLQVIAKPALIPWAVKTCADFLIEVLKNKKTITLEDIDEAKKQHRLKKESAGDWGTLVHKYIEMYCKEGDWIPDTEADPKVREAFCHFVKWTTDNKVTFLESEKHVYSRDMWVGGICDIVCRIGDQIWLADVKTGSGIYPEHFWQMASYEMCLKEMKKYDNVAGYIVLNLKKDGTFDEKRSISNEDNQKAFLASLTMYRIQEKIKNQVI